MLVERLLISQHIFRREKASFRLKDFLDRLTCIENLNLVKGETPCAGKVFGVLINGHEDGAMKTAMDI